MPTQDAINFISQAAIDPSLRDDLITLERSEILPALEKKGYKFNFEEFEDSVNVLHTRCQTQEQADFLFEVVWWFKLLYN